MTMYNQPLSTHSFTINETRFYVEVWPSPLNMHSRGFMLNVNSSNLEPEHNLDRWITGSIIATKVNGAIALVAGQYLLPDKNRTIENLPVDEKYTFKVKEKLPFYQSRFLDIYQQFEIVKPFYAQMMEELQKIANSLLTS